jgi:hypothetical protein
MFRGSREEGETEMNRRRWLLPASVGAIVGGSLVYAQQYPLVDMISEKVVQKYQAASCEQLWQRKGEPKSEREKEFIQLLKDDPQARTYFINQVAAPIVNKMFDCALIP